MIEAQVLDEAVGAGKAELRRRWQRWREAAHAGHPFDRQGLD